MIVVASHVNYQQAWQTLRESFVRHGQDLRDIVVVVAGASQLAIHANDNDSEVYIDVPYNFYEYTAVYGIYEFIDHPRVKDTCYVLVHDTSTAIEGFPVAYQNVKSVMEQDGLELLFLTPTKQLNQLAMSYNFIKQHGHRYGVNETKETAWAYEHGAHGSLRSWADPVKVRAIGDPIKYHKAIKYPGSDIFRHPVHISPICVVKYVANNDDINPPWQQRCRP